MAEVDQREIQAVAAIIDPEAFEGRAGGWMAYRGRIVEKACNDAIAKAIAAISALDRVRAGKKG